MGDIVTGLQLADQHLFTFLNGLNTPSMDVFMSWITARNTWIPFYFILIIFIWRKFAIKQAIIYILYLVAAVGLADFVTSGLMKPFFERPRPCHNEALDTIIHLVGGCGGAFGFASSHAANSFALFGGIFFVFRDYKLFTKLMLFWAILVSYSRIYVGVHYPGDVLVGAFFGFMISLSLYFFLKTMLIKQLTE